MGDGSSKPGASSPPKGAPLQLPERGPDPRTPGAFSQEAVPVNFLPASGATQPLSPHSFTSHPLFQPLPAALAALRPAQMPPAGPEAGPSDALDKSTSPPSVLEALEAWVRANPDATVYVWLSKEAETGRLTFRQLYDRAGTAHTPAPT